MKILVAEHHRLFLDGIKHIVYRLYPHASVLEVYNGHDALTAVASKEMSFDLTILDLRLPGIDGFTLLRKISQLKSIPPLLVISSSADPEDIKKAFHFGASGFVSKTSDPESLQAAIEDIISGAMYKAELAGEKHRSLAWAEQHNITTRQLEVLRLVKKGRLNNEIANQLYITERTVKAHMTALFDNFNAKSRTELVYKASNLGLD